VAVPIVLTLVLMRAGTYFNFIDGSLVLGDDRVMTKKAKMEVDVAGRPVKEITSSYIQYDNFDKYEY
jgi:hypothetical protein